MNFEPTIKMYLKAARTRRMKIDVDSRSVHRKISGYALLNSWDRKGIVAQHMTLPTFTSIFAHVEDALLGVQYVLANPRMYEGLRLRRCILSIELDTLSSNPSTFAPINRKPKLFAEFLSLVIAYPEYRRMLRRAAYKADPTIAQSERYKAHRKKLLLSRLSLRKADEEDLIGAYVLAYKVAPTLLFLDVEKGLNELIQNPSKNDVWILDYINFVIGAHGFDKKRTTTVREAILKELRRQRMERPARGVRWYDKTLLGIRDFILLLDPDVHDSMRLRSPYYKSFAWTSHTMSTTMHVSSTLRGVDGFHATWPARAGKCARCGHQHLFFVDPQVDGKGIRGTFAPDGFIEPLYISDAIPIQPNETGPIKMRSFTYCRFPALVAGYGDVVTGHEGFRCTHMQIRAFVLPIHEDQSYFLRKLAKQLLQKAFPDVPIMSARYDERVFILNDNGNYTVSNTPKCPRCGYKEYMSYENV